MANAKAQINPIQLQGAELNLNKFDAEIKPYSGFNKNNSPFVGGCLSNLYKKNEIIEGDVYIAPNGDKWGIEVESNRLPYTYITKNGQRYVYCGLDNIIQEELDLPNDIVYFFDDLPNNKIVSIKKGFDETYVCHLYGNIEMTFNILLGVYTSTSDFNRNVIDVKFNVQKGRDYSTNAVLYFVAVNTACQLDNGEIWGSYNVYFINSGTGDVSHIVGDNTTVTNFKLTNEKLQAPCLRGGSSYDSCFFAPNIYKAGENFIYLLDTDGSVESVNAITNNTGILISTDPKDYYFYCDYNLSPNVSGYSFVACFTGSKALTYTANTDVTKLIQFELEYEEGFKVLTGSKHNVSFTKTYAANTNVTFKTRINFTDPYAVSLCYYLSDKRFAMGVCDFQTGAVELKEDYFEFNTGAVSNGFVLSNNGIVTGLSSQLGYILTADWNNVAAYMPGVMVGSSDFNFVYKTTDGKWIRISEKHNNVRSPKLFVKNNYLVINTDYFQNAVNLTNGKVCYFAPSWNNRIMNVTPYNESTEAENVAYVASAINEYDLADCASIILNPLPSIKQIEAINTASTGDQNPTGYINYYSGRDEVLYIKSVYIGIEWYQIQPVVVRDKLVGLPFPTTTDSNIMLSPALFDEFIQSFGNNTFIKNGSTAYQMIVSGNINVPSYYLGTLVEGLEECFVIQGQYYGIVNDSIFAFSFQNGIFTNSQAVVSVEGLQFCGATPYEALFFSKTNKTLYSFNGANTLTVKQSVDKIGYIKNYKYNPSTHSIFLVTDIGVLCFSLFGSFELTDTEADEVILQNEGVIIRTGTTYVYIKYYLNENDTGFLKQNVKLETSFYGLNNQTVTINDCLYFRLFSEEHEENEIKVSATTISLQGRKTEDVIFRIKPSDWDNMTHSLYMRYQPKEQRGLGISFSIDSPFKIAAMSVGTQADAVLIDKVSKDAVIAPIQTTNQIKW